MPRRYPILPREMSWLNIRNASSAKHFAVLIDLARLPYNQHTIRLTFITIKASAIIIEYVAAFAPESEEAAQLSFIRTQSRRSRCNTSD